jgi:hypothetical protein
MSLPIFERPGLLAIVLALAGCGSPDADSGATIDCAMNGATSFERRCTLARMTSADGTVLVVGEEGAGYRRLLIATDGRGIVAADGVDSAQVRVIDDALIEVTVGADRFRLPATIGKPS